MLAGPRHRELTTIGRYLLASITGNTKGNNCVVVHRVKPTPTRFPTNSLYTPMRNTPLHSISSVCQPWGTICRDSVYVNPLLVRQHVTYSVHCTGMFVPAIYMKPKVFFPSLCFCSFELEKDMTLVKYLAHQTAQRKRNRYSRMMIWQAPLL